jgi:transposase
MAEILRLRGEAPEQLELRLRALDAELKKLVNLQPSGVTVAGSSEKLQREQVPKEPKKRRGHGPRQQPQLEVVTENYDVDEADQVCPVCGGSLEEWEGHEDTSEAIDVIERKFVLKKRIKTKRRCKGGCCIETAIAPPTVVPGGRYLPGFVVESVAMKYLDNTPLERQVKVFCREGLVIDRTTLWDQHWAVVMLLKDAWKRLKKHLLAQPVIGADGSPWPLVLQGGRKKWEVWALTAIDGVYFEIHPEKSVQAGKSLLGQYHGIVMADGAPTFGALAREVGFLLVCCWSHARRAFLKAEKTDPERVRAFLEMVAELFAIDGKASINGTHGQSNRGPPDLDKLRVLRDTESREAIKRLYGWLLEQRVLPQSDIGTAISYVGHRWTELTAFLDDPRIPLTNNHTERSFVAIAKGRQSYGGSRSTRGVIAAEVIYSLVGSAKLNGLEPKAYLKTALAAALDGNKVPLPHEIASQK